LLQSSLRLLPQLAAVAVRQPILKTGISK